MTDQRSAARVATKREREKRMVSQMIELYCRKRHGSRSGEPKMFCSNCRVHCYRPDMRERIRVVMRFSGPRMIFLHPLAAIRHMVETKREARRLKKGRQT